MNNSARNAGPVTPRTPNPSKRNLSSSSLSPSQTDKKSKVFITPNRFAALATNDPDDQEAAATSASNSLGAPPANQPHTVQARKMVIPPIVIKNIKNFSAFKNALTDITSSEGFTCRATSTYLKVIPSSRINYNTIIDYLHDTETSFHSYTPRHLRTYRVAIRNLHHSTLNTDIINALNELGHQVKHVYNAKNKSKSPLPLFFVDVLPQDNNKDIHDITSLLNTKVKIEKPHKKRSPPQCHNCQLYGHTKNGCSHKPRCVKCGENHLTEDCSKDCNSPAKCALCSGDHTANFKGCPVYKAASQKPAPKIPPTKRPEFKAHSTAKSYAEATKQQQNTHIEKFTDTCSMFISNLSSLINPLISLLSTVLNTLISKGNISP